MSVSIIFLIYRRSAASPMQADPHPATSSMLEDKNGKRNPSISSSLEPPIRPSCGWRHRRILEGQPTSSDTRVGSLSRPLAVRRKRRSSLREGYFHAHLRRRHHRLGPHGKLCAPFAVGQGRRRFGVRSADRGGSSRLVARLLPCLSAISTSKAKRIPTSATAPS